MSALAIRVEHVSKAYRLEFKQAHHRLSEVMVGVARAAGRAIAGGSSKRAGAAAQDQDTLWALNDVSFDISDGDVVGIVGRNGAGKSTLLKVMTRIVHPTAGRLELRGRIGSLLEVGTGFHPELTGRENVFLAGAVLGMSRKEIIRKFDAIVEFSGIERFIDTPVKRYSSGMHVRLGFAVAAHLDPEIMILDEVLSVGDAAFQQKCQAKFAEIRQSGCTIVVVSHNMNQIASLCRQAIWLQAGRIIEMGPAQDVIRSYISASSSELNVGQNSDKQELPANEDVRLLNLALCINDQEVSDRDLDIEQELTIRIDYEVLHGNQQLAVRVWLLDLYGTEVFGTSTAVTTKGTEVLVEAGREPGSYRAECRVPAGLLNAIDYRWRVVIRNLVTEQRVVVENALPFRGTAPQTSPADGEQFAAGVVRPRLSWNVQRLVEQMQ